MAMTDELEVLPTDGLVTIGEYDVRLQRGRESSAEHENAWRGGAKWALEEVARFTESVRAVAGPYDDMRAIETLETWIADRIREIHSPATNGTE
jgi:hypothetical protein